MRRSAVLMIAVLTLCTSDAWAQRQMKDPGVPLNYSPVKWFMKQPIQQGFYRLPGITEDYRLGPGDELEVFITEFSEYSLSLTVANSGEIAVPLVGRIDVSELTTEEVEVKIAAALADRGLIERPEVLVNVAEYQGKPIYVIGEVDNPGQYVMTQQLTLMEAIFLAGGLDFTADRYGYRHRRVSDRGSTMPGPTVLDHPDVPEPGREVIKVDLQPLKEGGVLSDDITLQRGDVLVVPKRQIRIVYVIGDVKCPGPFEIPAERTMRISHAVSASGGPRKTAKLSEGVLVRYDEFGKRSEYKVDCAAVLRGAQPDIEVRPNDVLFIPGSGAKRFGYSMLEIIPTLLTLALVI